MWSPEIERVASMPSSIEDTLAWVNNRLEEAVTDEQAAVCCLQTLNPKPETCHKNQHPRNLSLRQPQAMIPNKTKLTYKSSSPL